MPTIMPTYWRGRERSVREFEHDAPELTHVLVATGGGGLAELRPGTGRAQVISVEPEVVRRCMMRCAVAGRSRRRLADSLPTVLAPARLAH